MKKQSKIWIAGHRGLVGSSLVRKLSSLGYTNLLVKTKDELDLKDPRAVAAFFADEMPEYIFLAAAKVGGILANDTCPADFIYDNLMIQSNVIHCAHAYSARKLLFLGSSCIYPRLASQPITEQSILDGKLEETNKPYAVAKIAGLVMCEAFNRQWNTNFVAVMPTNLYGPNDNFDLHSSHVLPALVRKMHEARIACAPTVTLWGTGCPKREFLHVDDLADACVFLMLNYDSPEIINIGSGEDISIRELAELVKDVVGYAGELLFDDSKPDGTPRKLLDISRLHSLGWKPAISLREGIKRTYEWYLADMARQCSSQLVLL